MAGVGRGLAANVVVGVGTVRCLVATGAPAGTLHEAGVMILRRVLHRVAVDLATDGLHLEMAAEAEIGVTGDEHPLIDRTVWIMAGNAAFLHRTVLEDKRTFLGRVALRASLVLAFHGSARAFDGVTLVDVMAIDTRDFAGQHRMGVGEAELTALFQMALEAGLRGLAGIDDGALAATGLDVNRTGTVAGFATDVGPLVILQGQLGMAGRTEMLDLVFVAIGALVGADESGAGHVRRGNDRAVDHDAAHQDQSPDGDASEYYRRFCPTTF